ncbi:ABC transporter permease [Demequina aurantiaca]|uniref:ABC transporter permease n=1 Tax=Demequina aurantiaca TaxID=676200 RepID=UPI00078320C2|nr:ABC transporter permease [Demequina aurantiaca]
MFRLAIKSIKHSPKRLILTAVAVALGVSLVAATQIFTNSLSSGFSDLFSDTYSSIDVVVEADPNSDVLFSPDEEPLSDADLAAVQATDGVADAYGVVITQGALVAPDAASNQPGPPTFVQNWNGNADIDTGAIAEGTAPTGPGDVVLDADTFASGYALGDTVKIAGSEGSSEYTLVGSVELTSGTSLGAKFAWMSTDDVHAFNSDIPGYSTISVIADEDANVDDVAAAIGEELPEGTRAITGEDKAAESVEAVQSVVQYVDIFSIAFALISLFVGAYIIVNTFRIIVTQRTREFGLLRAVGVTGQQVRRMILLEALVVGIVASTIGLIMGYVLALGITAIAKLAVGDIFGVLTLPPDAIAWAYGLGLLVTMASAIAPAIHASRISPMEALRESATESKKPLHTRNIVGSAMAIIGIGTVFLGLFGDFDKPYIYVGVGAVLLVLGMSLLAAQFLVPIAFGLRGVLTRLFKVDGKLAANNIRREPRRSANTAAALMIGVMLLALVATFTESLKTTVTAQFDSTSADYFVIDTAGTGIPDSAIDLVTNTDGVDEVARVGVGPIQYDGADSRIAVIDVEASTDLMTFETDPDITEVGDGTYIGQAIQDQGVEVGDTVTLTGGGSTMDVEVTGLFNDENGGDFNVDWATGEEILGDVVVAQLLVSADPGTDVEALQTTLSDELAAEYPTVLVQSPGELAQFANQFIDLLLGVISALLGSALVIAILGVANTLLLSVTERTREIGLLRAVGLRKRSVWRMVTLESMVMAIFGAILGMLLGLGLGSALVLALADFGFDGVTVPWIWLGIYTVLAAIAGVVAAIWPAWRASKLDILKAIATE